MSVFAVNSSPIVFMAFADGTDVSDRVGIIEWAEQNIVIDKGPLPGRLRLSRTPYLREPLEMCAKAGVEQLTMMCSTQIGKTLLVMTALGYTIDQDPGDTLYVVPTERDAKDMSKERIQPMLFEMPSINRRLNGTARERKATRYMFDRMNVYFGWANSPASMASRPCRKSYFDEVAKFPNISGGQGSPVKLAKERNKNFWNKFRLVVSSPKKKTDEINKEYDKGDRRKYNVPCPHCNAYQELVWAQVKWDHSISHPEVLRMTNAAWYECAHCHEKILDGHKPKMLARGIWCPEGAHIEVDEEGNPYIVGAIETDHHSYRIWSAYSPFIKFAQLAAQWLESYKNIEDLMIFVNDWLGEPFEERSQDVKIEFVETLRAPYRIGTCPTGVLLITAGADTQKDHSWFAIRGWGAHGESWLLDHGIERVTEVLPPGKESNEDVEKLRERLENRRFEGANGQLLPISMVCWDSAHRGEMIYKATRKSAHMMKPVKGANRRIPQGYEVTVLDRTSAGKKIGTFSLYQLDTEHYKDLVHSARSQQPTLWHLPEDIDKTYLLQVSSEHKIVERDTKGRPREVWAIKPDQPDNHLWDCEVYARAAMDICGGIRRLTPAVQAPAVKRAPLRTPDGRPFFVGNR